MHSSLVVFSPNENTYIFIDFYENGCQSCYIDGVAQDCSNSIANALELLQSCAEPLI